MEKVYSIDKDRVIEILKTSENGLSFEEAKRRIEKYGKNQLEEKKEKPVVIFLRQFNNPLVFILIFAAVITVFLGDILDAGIITGIILVNGIIGFIQELKAQASLEALKKLTETRAKVIREGKIIQIPISEITVGDILLLEEGDVVPADARLIESSGLLVDESILTGESIPVEKESNVILPEDTPLYKRKNIVFKGTIVVRGKAKAVVYAVGKNTEIGKIAEKVKEKSPDTPLQRALKSFSKKWIFILLIILTSIFIIGIIQGRDFYTLFLLIVSELVSAVPEGLPLVVTFILVIGAMKLAKKKTLTKYLPAVETLGSATYIISDKTGTITEGKLQVKEFFTTNKDRFFMALALCNDATLEKGDPLEIAILKWLDEQGYDWKRVREQHPRIWEHPFDTKLRLMATINKVDGKNFLFVKGALESLEKLASENIEKLKQIHDKMAENGLRVIAVGYTQTNKDEVNIEKVTINIIGLIGFLDPPKKGVKEAVEVARKAGIRVVMVTGDNIKTAVAIAKMVGIYKEGDFSLLGKQIDSYSEKELYSVLKRTSVVARATPENKYQIVKTLQKNLEIVAVTGDGVNDVPALKVADLGIAMGSGTEAAKEVAKMIITDNNLAVIVDAIKYGRTIAQNLRKTIYYLLSCSFGEIGLISSAFILNYPLPLHPIQILWINVVTEGVQDKTFAFNKEELDLMQQKPKKPEKVFFDKKQMFDILFSAVLMTLITLGIFIYTLNTSSVEFAVTMAFSTLIVSQWFNGIQSIKTTPFFLNPISSIASNPYMYVAVLIGFSLQLIMVYFFPEFLHVIPISVNDWIVIFAASFVFFVVIEIKKWIEYLLKAKKIIKNF